MPWYFSYGSNNVKQLQNRLAKTNLTVYPGWLDNYHKTYVGYNKNWDSRVATLVKSSEDLVLGSLVYLSDKDLSILDTYEPHYNRISLKVTIIINDKSQLIDAIGYIHKKIKNPVVNKYPVSTKYLKACYDNINQVWNVGSFKDWVKT